MTINSAYFTAIQDQATLCRTCADVQALADRSLPQLTDLLAAIAGQEAVLAAAQELLTLNPANLAQVITFVQKLTTEVLGPMLAAYAKTVAQAAETATAVTATIAAIESAGSAIPGCTITV